MWEAMMDELVMGTDAEITPLDIVEALLLDEEMAGELETCIS